MPTTTASLIVSLEIIASEATKMLAALDELNPSSTHRREAKRRVLLIRSNEQELFDWVTAVPLEQARQ